MTRTIPGIKDWVIERPMIQPLCDDLLLQYPVPALQDVCTALEIPLGVTQQGKRPIYSYSLVAILTALAKRASRGAINTSSPGTEGGTP